MAQTAAQLTDAIFPDVPLRQWSTSFPIPLHFLFAAHLRQGARGKLLRIVYRATATHLKHHDMECCVLLFRNKRK
jgi:hypothetical protein